ncbi:tyrosine-type recombinase/integrase [Pseudoxanthomonas wuyuanensis]|uniref:tyrosine-type recombinase/integrase n=1 Tax=Pseudoxanthomonas wuyuanensis TaxID=1073196 RepID=UPI00138A0369|nr:site-specific integrase [Pseudoxanthomonas wuyuanensis]
MKSNFTQRLLSMALSDTAVRNAKPEPGKRVTKLHDRDGLFLHIAPTGTKSWVARYRIHGKERSIALGRYPSLGLAGARTKAQEARRTLASGVDPVQEKRRQAAEAATTDAARFAVVADDWRKRQAWSPAVRKQYDKMFERDILPALGRLPVADIDIDAVQTVVDRVAKRGKVVAGHVLLLIRGVLAQAVAKKQIPYNLAREVRAPKRPKGAKQSYRHLEGSTAVRSLLDKLDGYGGRPETVIALRLLLLCFTRPTELREARWVEFDLDAVDANGKAAPTWTIPGERMKRGRPHIIPLSDQATALLRDLQTLTGTAGWLFPHSRDTKKPMARETLLRALRDYMKLPTTVHGFRHLASTTLNAQGFNRDHIELQLAHWREDTRGAYNKAQWLPERRSMLQAWADWLDRIRVPADNVIELRGVA